MRCGRAGRYAFIDLIQRCGETARVTDVMADYERAEDFSRLCGIRLTDQVAWT
jgi:hypothetical protein